MRATGVQLEFEMTLRAEALEHAITCTRRPSGLAHRHFGAITRMAIDRCFYAPTARQHTLANSLVGAPNFTALDLRHKRLLSR